MDAGRQFQPGKGVHARQQLDPPVAPGVARRRPKARSAAASCSSRPARSIQAAESARAARRPGDRSRVGEPASNDGSMLRRQQPHFVRLPAGEGAERDEAVAVENDSLAGGSFLLDQPAVGHSSLRARTASLGATQLALRPSAARPAARSSWLCRCASDAPARGPWFLNTRP